MTTSEYSEDALVELPTIALFSDMRWETANCYTETFLPGGGSQGRETPEEVVLVRRIRPILKSFNLTLPDEAIDLAIAELTRDRRSMSIVHANREIYHLLKDGIKVSWKNLQGETVTDKVKMIDWQNPENNKFLLASQFWITGDLYKRRCDLVGFVNGIPFMVMENKASHKNLKNAYEENIRDYKTAIPQLFRYNAFIILSNGSRSAIGTISSEWEHFSEWKRINSEGETGIVSIETMVRGTCDKKKFLDITENFILFFESKHGTIKILAKNHQYLGVNNAIETFLQTGKTKGRLGVFWHTQGSGKSYSMIFFSQKILRKIAGNWTFVIVTDRDELDDQIYDNFAYSGIIKENHARADSGEDLQRLLKEDHRFVFTLIQKFRTEKGKAYPELTGRSDIIVIADEAHRTQYDTLALNMRTALPNAAFIAFTGTPLMQTEEKTREVFGDYVSVYTYRQSTEDGATVPLYYENRIPELQLTNPKFNEEMGTLIGDAELTPEQQYKLEHDFGKEYLLITRSDRLERIAKDIVAHFMGRGFQGKAMVVSIDKATAVKMNDKVKKHWGVYLEGLKKGRSGLQGEALALLDQKIEYMEKTDLAVVVSQSQNEIEDLKRKGVNIVPHRTRMVKEDLASKFKDENDPLRIAFVCAMWLTGFDAPACSTIYLDKPMKDHTLMQTIARANRVFGEKFNGLIVDYFGVFKNLQKALAIYAPGRGTDEVMPVQQKAELVKLLKMVLDETKAFCDLKGIDVDEVLKARNLQKVKLLDDSIDAILVNDESKQKFLNLAGNINRLFRAIKPDPAINELLPLCTLYLILSLKIRSLTPTADISQIMESIEELLDRSISTEGYVIKPPVILDLSQLNLDVLQEKINRNRARTETEKLRALVERKIQDLLALNRTRIDFSVKLQQMIDEYNSSSHNTEEFFKRLVAFAKDLQEEEKRAIKENLTEEELTIFDLLTKPPMKLSKREEGEVKKVAKELLETLKQEKLVLDWRKKQQTRAAVRLCIEDVLDHLPPTYSKDIYQGKCEIIYQHIFEAYPSPGTAGSMVTG
jgi:type I restriction enzyme R subunit